MSTRKTTVLVLPTLEQLEQARVRFEAYEPRDLFYRAATELVDIALRGQTTLSVGESLAVLLQTWNAQFYRFHSFESRHFNAIDEIVECHRAALTSYRSRSITSMCTDEFDCIATLFTTFERGVGCAVEFR